MKKKTFFKILALSIVVMLLAITISTYSQAAITPSTNTGTIIVSKLEAGVTVTAYQVVKVDYDYDADQPRGYSWDTNVQNWINTNFSEYDTTEKFYDAVNGDAEKAQEFYSSLAAAIKEGTVTGLTTKTDPVAGTQTYPVEEATLTGEATLENCEMGTYLILIENGYRVYRPSAVNLIPESDSGEYNLPEQVTATVKSTNPQITKKITDETAVKDNYSTKDTMTFTIMADVPNYLEESKSKNYYISDKFTNGTIDTSSVQVYGMNGSTPTSLTAGNEYQITTSNAQRLTGTDKNVDFLLDFDYDKISGYEKIKVTYHATLNKNTTIMGTTGSKNNAYLDYSNNPYSETSYQTQDSSDTVYSYGIEITKVDKSNHETTLAGAEFNLLSGSNALYFVGSNGVYYQANEGEGGATQTLVVDSQGKLCIYGLDEGSYSLKETKAPNDYNISTTPLSIPIVDANKDGRLDTGDTNGTGIYTADFENSKGFVLPVTGGIGTVVFVATGVVIVGLGITLLIVVFKKNRLTK